MQVSLVPHARPQDPQFLPSVCKFVQDGPVLLTQRSYPVGQVITG